MIASRSQSQQHRPRSTALTD